MIESCTKALIWTETGVKASHDTKKMCLKPLELIVLGVNRTYTLVRRFRHLAWCGTLTGWSSNSYLSRFLEGSEKNYTITENELFASIWTMKKCKFFQIV